ncbi:MAG: hypothetical protein M0Q88_00940 [Bacilli bacterium]|nr:hypothetical protein [Bacilli bacterium]
MITSVTNEHLYEFRGLSTDTKPLGVNLVNGNVNYIVSNGSVFIEMDSGDVYLLKVTPAGDGKYTGEWVLF